MCKLPTLLCFQAMLATQAHTGSLGREEGLHVMSSVLIMRLDVIVKAPEKGLLGKIQDTWG